MNVCVSCGPAPDSSKLPRSKWREHPRFPDQVLLVNSHEGFRSVSRRLIALAQPASRAGHDTWRADIRWSFRSWHGAMGSHEAYEEHKLYPYLARRYRVSLAHLEADHAALHELRDDVYAALDKGTDDDVLRALERYHEELLAHLEREEAAVIPLLLELTPEEFRRYYHAYSVDELLAELPAC